jgi:hypothetical protein
MTLTPSYLIWVALIYLLYLAYALFCTALNQQRDTEKEFWALYEARGEDLAKRLHIQFFFLVGLVVQYGFTRVLQ